MSSRARRHNQGPYRQPEGTHSNQQNRSNQSGGLGSDGRNRSHRSSNRGTRFQNNYGNQEENAGNQESRYQDEYLDDAYGGGFWSVDVGAQGNQPSNQNIYDEGQDYGHHYPRDASGTGQQSWNRGNRDTRSPIGMQNFQGENQNRQIRGNWGPEQDYSSSQREWELSEMSGRSIGSRSRGSRGEYEGKGPKGYQRSDERITEDINEELTQHGEIDASEIEVKVKNGEVTLTGTVADRQQKRLAEDLAEYVSGVVDVINQIRVSRGGQAEAEQPTTRTKREK